MTDEVQQAAERLRLVDSYGIDLAAMLTSEGIDPQLPRHLVAVMRAYLATVAADDGEAITEEWLLSVGFRARRATCLEYVLGPYMWSLRPVGGGLAFFTGGYALCVLEDRKDVRNLGIALGIALKPSGQETK